MDGAYCANASAWTVSTKLKVMVEMDFSSIMEPRAVLSITCSVTSGMTHIKEHLSEPEMTPTPVDDHGARKLSRTVYCSASGTSQSYTITLERENYISLFSSSLEEMRPCKTILCSMDFFKKGLRPMMCVSSSVLLHSFGVHASTAL